MKFAYSERPARKAESAIAMIAVLIVVKVFSFRELSPKMMT